MHFILFELLQKDIAGSRTLVTMREVYRGAFVHVPLLIIVLLCHACKCTARDGVINENHWRQISIIERHTRASIRLTLKAHFKCALASAAATRDPRVVGVKGWRGRVETKRKRKARNSCEYRKRAEISTARLENYRSLSNWPTDQPINQSPPAHTVDIKKPSDRLYSRYWSELT